MTAAEDEAIRRVEAELDRTRREIASRPPLSADRLQWLKNWAKQ